MQPGTLTLNSTAFLTEHKDGWIYLVYGGHLYARAELVPLDIAVKAPRPEALFSADTYVRACMMEQFGSDFDKWPSLARHFLGPDLPPG